MVFKKDQKAKKYQAFTLVEILLAMAIIGILSTSIVRVLNVSSTRSGLLLEAQKLATFLRDQQNKALAVKMGDTGTRYCAFGIWISDNSYYEYNAAASAVSQGSGINTCSSINLAKGSSIIYAPKNTKVTPGSVYFSVPFGDVTGAGKFTLTDSKTGKSVDVTVTSSGEIMIGEVD